MGSLAKKALTSCAGTLREAHVMFEASLPDRHMEPGIPLPGLSRLTRLETLYIDMSTSFGPYPGLDRSTTVNYHEKIEELLPCASLQKPHVFHDYALAKRYWDDYGGGGDDGLVDAVLARTLFHPLLGAYDEARFPHLRLVSVRTLILDGVVFAREVVSAFANKNKKIGFVMSKGIIGGSRSWSPNSCFSPMQTSRRWKRV